MSNINVTVSLDVQPGSTHAQAACTNSRVHKVEQMANSTQEVATQLHIVCLDFSITVT